MNLILLVPAIASLFVILTASTEAALLSVYLPTLLLLPDFYYLGFQSFTFTQWALIPIGLALLPSLFDGRWRPSILDVSLVAYAAWTLLSEAHAVGGMLTATAAIVTTVLFPYMAGKLLIEQKGLGVVFARRFVFLLFAVSVISLFEFVTGFDPFQEPWARWFGYSPWFTQSRFGFARATGPFGSPIFLGAIVGPGIVFHRYLSRCGFWEPTFRWIRLNKSRVIFLGLAAGLIIPLSRGPWIGFVAGILVSSIGFAVHRWRALRWTVALLLVCGSLLYFGGKAYIDGVATYDPTQEMASTAAYRAALIDEYVKIAEQKPLWGWGATDWPTIPGMVSVDNAYLLTALNYGFTGLAVLVVLLLTGFIRLFRAAMAPTELAEDCRAMMFALAGVIAMISVTITTVFLGNQLAPLLFLLLGWSDACLQHARPPEPAAPPVALAPAFAFRGVWS